MKKCPYCAEEIQNEAIKCKHCGEILDKTKPKSEMKWAKVCPKCLKKYPDNLKTCPKHFFTNLQKTEVTATEGMVSKIISKRQTSGTGLALELIGIILLFVFPPMGAIFGIAFLIYGFNQSKKNICSECGNKIEDKDVKICPACKASFV